MSKRQKQLGIGIILIILCAIAFYFFYWIKTPTYSLGIIKESIEKHDVATFEKHVDLDSLYTKGFDDLIVAADKIQGDNTLSNPLAAGFIQMLKQPVVAALKEETLHAIKGEKEDNAQKSENIADTFTKEMKSKSGLDSAAFKNASEISNDGKEAVVALTLHHQKFDTDFDVNIKMAKLDDGTWKVKEITNLVDVVVSLDKAEKEKIAELNKPLKEEMKAAISTSKESIDLYRGTNRRPMYRLHYEMYFTNNTDKDIDKFTTLISVVDDDNQTYKQCPITFSQRLFKAHSSIPLTYYDQLNPYSAKDKELINSLDGKKMIVDIVYIHYTDGTEMKLLTELPDEEVQ